MPEGRRLTGCGASDHPDPAVAVGEVVGHLQNSLAGSPQFALVLVDAKNGSLLSTIAATVHRLLGPDLLLAVAATHVAGAEVLGSARASVVVWAVCGIDVTAVDDEDRRPTGTPDTSGSGILAMHQRSDGSVVVGFRTGADAPRPLFISGDGRMWRPMRPSIGFAAGSATLIRARGHREVGPTMVATEARGRTLLRLDHVPVRAVLVDQLETTEAFVDGPSVEFPPLRARVHRSSDLVGGGGLIDIIAVDPEDGSVELADEVDVGDRVQLIAHDPEVAARVVIEHVGRSDTPGDRGVLTDHEIGSQHADFLDPIAVATIGAVSTGTAGGEPWAEVAAVLVHAFDED